jgi:DNA repair exonuclease SbcCD nuclease subunit
MRICHLADSHLGAGEHHAQRGETGLTVRQEDILNSFGEAVERIIALRPDVCLHAGDLFHAVRPLNRIMAIAGDWLHRLAGEAGIPTVVIAGNHDSPRQPYVGAALDVYRRIPNLYVATGDRTERFRFGDTCVTVLPHCHTIDVQKAQLSLCVPDPAARFNVLMLHGVASGMPEFSMADLGEQELPLEIMAPFDYTALGHFHNCCQVGPRAWYAGSTERLSQSEREAPKGFLEVSLDPFAVTFYEVATRPMVDLLTVDASGRRGDQVLADIRRRLQDIGSTDKIVRIKVEGVSDETLRTMPSDQLADLKRQTFALDVRFEKAKDPEAESQFGQSAIGRLDQGFVTYLETVDLTGFDQERLVAGALKYLRPED